MHTYIYNHVKRLILGIKDINTLSEYERNNQIKKRLINDPIKGTVSPSFNAGGRRIDKFHKSEIFEDPSSEIYQFENAKVFGNRGSIVTFDGFLISDFHAHYKDSKNCESLVRECIPKNYKKANNIGVFAAQSANFNYYHWLTDALPRLLLLKEVKSVWESLDVLYGPELQMSAQREAIHSVAKDLPYIKASDQVCLSCQSAYIPKRSGMYADRLLPTKPNVWISNLLKKHFLSLSEKSNTFFSDRLYISRSDSDTRYIFNENKLIESLNQIGFQKICLSELSFFDQIKAFSNASCVVGPHGAGLSNLYFSKPGTKFIEITSEDAKGLGFFRAISCVSEIDYAYHATPLIKKGNESYFNINIHSLIKGIEEFID